MRSRLTQIAGLALLLVAAIASAAEAKPSVAILGIEVIDDGSIDAKTTRAAQKLTEELRAQATRADGDFDLAPNSAKDLLELKLLSDCSDEGRGCMATIGRDLDADLLIYGKLERTDDGYSISLQLLETESEELLKTTTEDIPKGELSGKDASRWAQTLYGRLAGAPSGGSIDIQTNVESGTVYVDGEIATTLSGGQAKVLGLDEGIHQLAIEAPGYQRYTAEVAVAEGDTEMVSVSMSALEASGGQKDSRTGWKIAFFSGLVVTAGATGGWIYEGRAVVGDLKDKKNQAFNEILESQNADRDVGLIASRSSDVLLENGPPPGGCNEVWADWENADPDARAMCDQIRSIGDACEAAQKLPKSGVSDELRNYIKTCERGERAALLTNVLVGASIASAIVTAYFGYKAYVSENEVRPPGSVRHDKKRAPVVQIAPAVTPNSVGAGLTIEF